MFDIGGGEIFLIVLVVLLLFGPKKIPEVAQMLGKGMREFRRAQDNLRQQIRDISTDVDTTIQSVDAPVRASVQETPPMAVPEEPADPAHTTLPMNFEEAPNEVPAQDDFPKPQIRPAESAIARPVRRDPPGDTPPSENPAE